jgi:hypothetical protein
MALRRSDRYRIIPVVAAYRKVSLYKRTLLILALNRGHSLGVSNIESTVRYLGIGDLYRIMDHGLAIGRSH